MIYCMHCVENVETILDPDNGTTCCVNCGRVVEVSCFTSEVEFVKDKHGQSRVSGQLIRSAESSFSASRERTIQKARDEIWDIVTQLDIGGGEQTVDQAFRFYEMALDKNFTRGRRTSHVAAACVYMTCRANKKAYLLIDFSDHLSISVYVLGAVFLQLCELLKLSEHPLVQTITDPSLYIHRFTDRLLGRRDEAVARTALQIVASMKRDWMQTGRKPSGLCGAALYISVLSHGLTYTKSDVVTVVHICEQTLTKRLIEFENTDSGSLTIEEFVSKAEEIDQNLKQSQRPKPGELVCKHKSWEQHYAHGLCKNCYDEFMQLSGGLIGGSDPPAFQRAEKQRELEEPEMIEELCVDEIEADLSKIDSDLIKPELPASKVNESNGSQIEGVPEIDFQDAEKYNCDGPESLSDIDDGEVDAYLHNEEEQRLKTIIWEEMNKEYLEEQKLKALLNESGESKPKKKRTRTAGDKNSAPADSPLEATKQMLKKKTFSSRVNYEALESLYTKDDEKQVKNNNENGDGKNKEDEAKGNAYNSDKETKSNGDEDTYAYGDEDVEGVEYDPIYDENYGFDADENKTYAYEDVDFD